MGRSGVGDGTMFPEGAFLISRRVFGTPDRGDVVVITHAPDG